MSNLVVKPPEVSDNTPDEATKKGPPLIDGGAPNQVFRFEKFGVSYGTDDKGHAASILLSSVILCLLALVFIVGAFSDREWIGEAITILGTAFTFTAGVAIGKGSRQDRSED